MGIFNKGNNSISKDIKEALKTLSYLARSEKYFDLEIIKNGARVKPLLRIVDIIDPLRQISDITQRIEKDLYVEKPKLEAFRYVSEITEVCADILALNPKGLISSDRNYLARLPERLLHAKNLAGAPDFSPIAITSPAPTPEAGAEDGFGRLKSQRLENTIEFVESRAINVGLNENQVTSTFTPTALPEVEFDEEVSLEVAVVAETKTEAPAKTAATKVAVEEPVAEAEEEKEETKVVPISRQKKGKKMTFNTKYFATSYAGMNLQEAADIISELASVPANLTLVLKEHASTVKPVAQGKDIVADLMTIAAIADSFENGVEVEDKKQITVLKSADKIITICRDIAALEAEGLDKRKQKLLDRFIPQDIQKTLELAKVGYPEAFSATDASGELAAPILLDFADLLQSRADDVDDEVFTKLLAQNLYQVAAYASHNQIKLKFDIITKKNKLNSKVKALSTREEKALVRAVSFVPYIARQSQEVLTLKGLKEDEAATVTKSLELLQLIYVHARDNFSAEATEGGKNKAA